MPADRPVRLQQAGQIAPPPPPPTPQPPPPPPHPPLSHGRGRAGAARRVRGSCGVGQKIQRAAAGKASRARRTEVWRPGRLVPRTARHLAPRSHQEHPPPRLRQEPRRVDLQRLRNRQSSAARAPHTAAKSCPPCEVSNPPTFSITTIWEASPLGVQRRDQPPEPHEGRRPPSGQAGPRPGQAEILAGGSTPRPGRRRPADRRPRGPTRPPRGNPRPRNWPGRSPPSPRRNRWRTGTAIRSPAPAAPSRRRRRTRERVKAARPHGRQGRAIWPREGMGRRIAGGSKTALAKPRGPL